VRSGVVLVGLALLWPGAVAAQGLGDAAARERARRAPDTPATTVFTNEDLAARSEGGRADDEGDTTPAEGEEPGVATAPDEPVDPVRAKLDREREERALEEREWRARFAEARAVVREAEARCWQEVVRTEFYQGIPVQMKVQEFVESEEYRQAKVALEDLNEEFRRTGRPPGWARE
jgi:hypothetical protein